MKERFLELLQAAQGQSEFAIVVVADIRGFSDFSRQHESPDTAMFIKRFYIRLLTEYFPSVGFVKPTGDGLLMVFPYDEHTLQSVSETVVAACLRCLDDFPTICNDDPMINFDVPRSIGFGVARGTACRLFSGNDVLDYSGHLLNLAARLNDLARPKGVVIDGNFRLELLSQTVQEQFATQRVFVRGIAEDTPIEALILKGVVQVPESNLAPIGPAPWRGHTHVLTVREVTKLSQSYLIELPTRAQAGKLRVEVSLPKKGVKNVLEILDCLFEHQERASGDAVVIDIATLQDRLKEQRLATGDVTFTIDYVEKIGRRITEEEPTRPEVIPAAQQAVEADGRASS